MRLHHLVPTLIAPFMVLVAAPAAEAAGIASLPYLTYLSQTDFPTGSSYGGTVIGGLSGIDYDATTNTFISQTDHGYQGSGTHFYTLAPTYTAGRPGFGLAFNGVTPLGPDNTESIRFDPKGKGVWYTTEETVPGIYHRFSDGTTVRLPTPTNIATRSQDNYSLEGSTFLPNGQLAISMENALRGDATDLTRISVLNQNGTLAAQYAYRLDTLPGIANPPNVIGSTNNGVSEILSLGGDSLLVLERAYDGGAAQGEGASHNSIRLYRVDFDGASNIDAVDDLDETTRALSKTLVFDSSSLSGELDTTLTKVDNIEGMTFGPRLADGDLSLVLVNDNNYRAGQYKTQFLVFDVNPDLLAITPVPLPPSLPTFGAGVAALGLSGAVMRRRRKTAIKA